MAETAPGPATILFTHYGDEWIRGSERCLLDLLTYIDRRRFRPVLWCNAQTLAAEVGRLDVPAHVSRFTMLLDWVPPKYELGRFLRLVREGKQLARQYGARVLHSNSAAPTQWLFPVARGLRLPLLTHLHAPYGKRERVTLGLHQTNLAVGVTRGCIEGLLEDGLPAERTATIYNGVDLSAWNGHDQTDLRTRLGIAPDEIVITQAGSLIRRKGHDILLQSFAELQRQGRNCRLIIVGDGPDRPAIESLCRELGLSDRVHFLGFIPTPPGVVFRDATDIAVSPSRQEGFGLTVIEAGASGRAVVATDTTGMREIVDHERTGLIVPIEDVASLTQALFRLVDDATLRQRLGTALQETVEERFLIRSYIRNLEAAYTRLLNLPKEELGWRRGGARGQLGMYLRWTGEVIARRGARWFGAEPAGRQAADPA